METAEIMIKILFAIIAAGLIGFEREIRNRPAGFRTHILVCVGATIVALIQLQLVKDVESMIHLNPALANSLKTDIGRIIAQVVTGVGFLGAGTIIFHNGNVKGLTTATSLWVVACLGIAIGLGYYVISIIATISILFVVIPLKKLESSARKKINTTTFHIKYKQTNQEIINSIMGAINSNNGKVTNINILNGENGLCTCSIDVFIKGTKNQENIINTLGNIAGISSIEQVMELQS